MTESAAAVVLAVPRDLRAIARCSSAVRSYALQIMGEDDASAVELALVEALTNAIKHGTAAQRDAGCISVNLRTTNGNLILEITDGSPLVPDGMLEQLGEHRLEFDYNDIDSIAEGGRGLSLIVLSMDEVSLRSSEHEFTLLMMKRGRQQGNPTDGDID